MGNNAETSSNHFIRLLAKANQYRLLDDYPQALAIYREAIRQFGESADLCRQAAFCHYQIGLYQDSFTDFEEAITWIGRAIELDPGQSDLHDTLGEFYMLGTVEYEKAIQEFQQAVALNPNNFHALKLGSSLYDVPEKVIPLPEAIQWLERAVELEPNDAHSRVRLGKMYQDAGRLEDAKHQWLQALLCPRPLDWEPAQVLELFGLA